VYVVSKHQGNAGAEGGGLGEREIDEDYAPLNDVKAEIDEQPGQDEASR